MAKPRKKTDQPTRATAQDVRVLPGRGLEALGIAMLILALGLCFALFSFDPRDASGGGNLVGPAGVRVARVLLGGIGVVGYVAGLSCVALAGLTLLGRVRLPSILQLASGLGIMLGATVLAHLMAGGSDLLGHPAGGAVGMIAGELLRSGAGPAGAALVGVGLVAVGVLGISDLSFSAALHDAGRAARFVGTAVAGRTRIWLEARSAARLRETELVEAARSQRAQAEIERSARARTLEEDLEEKKRVAVLKATAKAEQKALEKIAALDAKERLAHEAAERRALEEEEEESEVDDEEEEMDEPEEELVSLGIPGPGAEPDIIIGGFGPIEDSAEVIERIDRATQLPAPAAESEDEDEEEYEEEVDAEYEEEDSEDEEEETFEEDEAGGPMIHERKRLEASLDDGPVEARPVVPEKTVYQLPPLNLLDHEGDAPQPVDGELLRSKATRLEEKLKTYGVEGKVVAIRPGPVVTTYEYQPAPGVKVAKIANLSDDIAMSMEAMRVRIVAPIPGRGVVGIELPNETRENVYLKELVGHESFKKSKSLLTIALGKDAEGEPQVRDLRKMPHLLIAGTTGSGKSVSINTMILSVLYKATPDQVKFIMVDPKMLELSLYEDIPHLLLPVVTDARKASLALQWAVDEMERRYQMLSDMKVRDIDGFNRRLERLAAQRRGDADAARLGLADDEEDGEPGASSPPTPSFLSSAEKGRAHDPWPGKELPEPLPYIVVLIDEFADLMCVAPRDVEASVQRLAQKARASGIHVLLATQRPSTDVITGVIKNNFPSRVSFRVASRHDSATILNAPGAENLLGMGDSLYLSVASPNPERVHAGFVSEDEVERVVAFWKAQAKPKYDPTILQKRESEDDGDGGFGAEEVDEHYDAAVRMVTETRRASISALQRRLRVGYNRAARMIEMMEVHGIVGPAVGAKGEREVLVLAMGPDGPVRS